MVSKCLRRRVTSTNCRARRRVFAASDIAQRPPTLSNNNQRGRRKIIQCASQLNDPHVMVKESTRSERASSPDRVSGLNQINRAVRRSEEHTSELQSRFDLV